ncbi:hypothetical protein DH2020_037833 [Rehmannia glutinosa]|uniref:F-box domain-containing protein n=1 Tax=Rehmannia glutinosa TaxID=99300 RepID=A0ABR0V0L6_REHGL
MQPPVRPPPPRNFLAVKILEPFAEATINLVMLPDLCGSSLLLALPDDIFSLIARSLSPRDVCSLGLSCRDLHAIVASDKALCRFLVNIHPLIGIWVHQNPELGNVVYVMPGFLSVVGCRIIPQEVGPLGLEEGPILWTPVFEILCNYEGSTTFFLHGRERGVDYVYPGLLKSVDRKSNVLLLEVEPRHQRNVGKLAYSKSFAHDVDKEVSRRLSRSSSGISKSQRLVGQKGTGINFSRLGFGDRRRLLDVVTSQTRLNIPRDSKLDVFPRRGNGNHDLKPGSESPLNPTVLGSSEVCKSLDCTSGYHALKAGDAEQANYPKGKTLSGFLKNGLKQILGKSSSTYGNRDFQKKNASSCNSKHVQLHEFLQSGDMIGLSLRASTMKLSSYRAWPNMHDSRFALYKLPVRAPKACHEYAGLWGGTFGWPPGRPSEDKPGKALFFILISYEESEGQQLLIATKILEGTSYVLHPNGSAMFIVNIDQPSTDTFPWGTDEDSNHIDVKQSFMGEGIANGYGFRYPGSKPGSLFIIQNGLLVFIWKESRAVLTLQKLNLADLLRKGERVPSLSPVSNFAYLTKTYSNVFSGF